MKLIKNYLRKPHVPTHRHTSSLAWNGHKKWAWWYADGGNRPCTLSQWQSPPWSGAQSQSSRSGAPTVEGLGSWACWSLRLCPQGWWILSHFLANRIDQHPCHARKIQKYFYHLVYYWTLWFRFWNQVVSASNANRPLLGCELELIYNWKLQNAHPREAG